MLPTLYYLIFKPSQDGYDVYERHQCQEKGCFLTEAEFIETVSNTVDMNEYADIFERNLVEGYVDGVEVLE